MFSLHATIWKQNCVFLFDQPHNGGSFTCFLFYRLIGFVFFYFVSTYFSFHFIRCGQGDGANAIAAWIEGCWSPGEEGISTCVRVYVCMMGTAKRQMGHNKSKRGRRMGHNAGGKKEYHGTYASHTWKKPVNRAWVAGFLVKPSFMSKTIASGYYFNRLNLSFPSKFRFGFPWQTNSCQTERETGGENWIRICNPLPRFGQKGIFGLAPRRFIKK